MDLPDIEIVVQWKATCELSMLWQRFGRAARGTGKEAIAILLVEKKDTNEERVKKADRAVKRKQKKENSTKRKAKTEDLKQRRHKRPALVDRSTNIQVKAEADDTDIGSCDGEDDDKGFEGFEAANPDDLDSVGLEECRAQYANQERADKSQVVQARGHQGPQIGSALDDFINDGGRFRCRRTVLMLFFGNDKTRECCVEM
jgi:superfamily II DNA/RNA helicase